jgi:hypothetical protein
MSNRTGWDVQRRMSAGYRDGAFKVAKDDRLHEWKREEPNCVERGAPAGGVTA